MDGLHAMRRIRENAPWQDIRIVAVSANASEADQAQCMAAGANAFLSKPIDPDALLDEVAEQLGLSWIAAALDAATGAASAAMVAPPPAQLEELHRIAVAGNMRAIHQRANEIAALDPHCAPFCEKLQRLASGYQSKAIVALVQQHLAQRSTR
jgi:CheY-like chemotaxis protein